MINSVYHPLVSVIVTTYNRKDSLEKTLKCILDQSYTNIEVIVVDNYSSFDFSSFINSLNDSRLRGFQNHNDGVIAINRNYGLKYTTGDYVAFCDDDDYWMLTKIQKQIEYITTHQLQDIKVVIYTNCINHQLALGKKEVTKKKNIITLNDFIFTNQITFSSSFVSLKNLTNNFNELPEFFAVEDYLFWCILKMENYQFFLIETPLVEYSITTTTSSMQNYGFNHLRSILVLAFITVKNKNLALNLFKVALSIVIHLAKYLAKITLKKLY